MKSLGCRVVMILIVVLVSTSEAQIPRTLSYQGVLTDSLGSPKPDGSYTFTFRLYNASSGGTSLWTEQKTLQLRRGLFSTTLGDQVLLGSNLRFDTQYWLGIQVAGGAELSPRVPLNAVGYSLHAVKSDTALYALTSPLQSCVDSARVAGTIADNSITSAKIVDGTITTADLVQGFKAPDAAIADTVRRAPSVSSCDSARIAGTVSNGAVSTTKLADLAVTTQKVADRTITTTKLNAAGSSAGQVLSSNGSTVGWSTPQGLTLPYFQSLAISGPAFWVSNSSAAGGNDMALVGYANAGQGILGQSVREDGIHGVTQNAGHAGVSALNNINNNFGYIGGPTYGAYGESSLPGGAGISGYGKTTTLPGVIGISDFGQGVVGHSNAPAGSFSVGVEGDCNAGFGVFGHSVSSDGVRGESSTGDGVRGESAGTTKSGVYGANGNSTGYGVFGRNTASSTSGYLGGEYGAEGLRGDFEGFLGFSDGAVLGRHNASGNYTYLGMSTRACMVSGGFYQSGGTFEAHPTSTIWTTNKPATVKIDNGSKVKLFAEEAAEVYFSDYGEATLQNGRIHIQLDPVFLQTITVDERHPIKVFVQMEEECNGVYVTNKSRTGFDVVELRGGTSSAHFSYRVVCKRKYYEDERLATEDQDTRFNSTMLQIVWPEVASERLAAQSKMREVEEHQRAITRH